LARKRELYWHNSARNPVIAALARAIAANDQEYLQILRLPARYLPILRRRGGQRVAVLVESPEHGRELKSMLKDWPLLIDQVDAHLRDRQKSQSSETVMVTTAYAARRGLKVDVIIRATGTEWGLCIKRFPPRQRKTGPKEIVVIDFADQAPAPAKADTERRIAGYKRQGMSVVTVSSDDY
jgi:hypothetical protein